MRATVLVILGVASTLGVGMPALSQESATITFGGSGGVHDLGGLRHGHYQLYVGRVIADIAEVGVNLSQVQMRVPIVSSSASSLDSGSPNKRGQFAPGEALKIPTKKQTWTQAAAMLRLRADIAPEQGIVPFATGGVAYIKNGSEEIGWIVGGGLLLRLDKLEPARAADVKNEFGLDDTFITLEAKRCSTKTHDAWLGSVGLQLAF